MAIIILIHVFFAFIAVGTTAFVVFSEWLGYKKQDADYITGAKKISKLLSDMMKINGVLGVAIIVLMIGLWGGFAKTLYSVMFWVFLTEGAFFMLLMIFAISYNNTWDKVSRKTHIILGAAAAFSAAATGFFINSIWAFMLAPGKWLQTGARIDAFNNPILWESTIHLILPCIINAALIIFLLTYKKTDYNKINKLSARIGASCILIQPLSGLSFLIKIKSISAQLPIPNPYSQLWTGLAKPYLYIMITLAVISALLSICYWILGHKKGRPALILASIAMFATFFIGGYAREKARKPYLIWGAMFMNQKITTETKNPLSKPNKITGKNVYNASECGACHIFKGEGGTMGPSLEDISEYYDKEDLKEFLQEPPEDMPPFEGTEEELNAMVEYLMTPKNELNE
ncbi:MAG: cytochrome ubiquinol oxidase subunit I [Deltaproteobacteria bacterium]|nr:cytochrome ubiquinol oxidase subunit I [Deltaproteobacteria bacterium]